MTLLGENAAYCDGQGIWYNIYEKMIAWLIVAIVGFVCAVILFISARRVKPDSESQCRVFRGYGLYAFGYAMGRILFIFSDIERWNNCISDTQLQLVFFGHAATFLAAVSILRTVEYEILNIKKQPLTIFLFICSVGMLIFATFIRWFRDYVSVARPLSLVINLLTVLFLAYIFTSLIRKSTGSVRKKARLTITGIFLIAVGSILDSELFIKSLSIPIWSPALLPVIGFITMIYVQLRSVADDE